MLGKIAGIASGIGALGSIFGDGKNAGSPPVAGYASLDPEKKKFGDEVLFEDLKSIYDAPRPKLPYRQLTEAEMADRGLFAPTALQALQAYQLSQAGQGDGNQEDGDSGSNATLDELFARVTLNQLAGPGGVYGNKSTRRFEQLRNSATPDQLQEIGAIIRSNNARVGSGMFAGQLVGEDGVPLAQRGVHDHLKLGLS